MSKIQEGKDEAAPAGGEGEKGEASGGEEAGKGEGSEDKAPGAQKEKQPQPDRATGSRRSPSPPKSGKVREARRKRVWPAVAIATN